MTRSTILVVICMIAGTIVLCSLGTWQVKRMYWKEALIERVNNRISSIPQSLDSLLESGLSKQDHEYLPVTVEGRFDHNKEVYFFTTDKNGSSGWNVHTPILMDEGRTIIINRGFVPYERKGPASRSAGQVEGIQKITGLLRFPLTEKPLGSLDNDLSSREFYWRNTAEMAQAMNLDAKVLPLIVDANETAIPGDLPRGGTTIVSFSNNHMQYAITWFGLCLTLLGVGGYYIYSRQIESND